LCVGTVHKFHVSRLKIFAGTREQAEAASRLDHDQYVIDEILYWRGNPAIRTTMEFFVRYKDGEAKWVVWSKDLFDSVQYEQFCRANPPLFPLIFTVKEAEKKLSQLRQQPISAVQPGVKVYVDVRYFGGCTWYASIGLPEAHTKTYVFYCEYGDWIGTRKKKINLHVLVTNEIFPVDNLFVATYGSAKSFVPGHMVLVTKPMVKKYPKLLND
jgi:hypothetical protein